MVDPSLALLLGEGAQLLPQAAIGVETLLSSPREIHSLQLGIYAGIVVSIFLYRGYVPSGLTVLLLFVVFALGIPDGELLCSSPSGACFHRPVQTKPHYFLTGTLSAVLALPLAARAVLGPDLVDPFATVRPYWEERETDPTVLVVDDEEELVDLYADFLSGEYEVCTATSGPTALETADKRIDVALLDRRMPEMSGDDLLRALRDQGFDYQVAMLTAVEPDADIIDLPFDDYRVKPVDENELLGLVEVLLGRADYDDQSQEFFTLASKKAALEVAGNDDTEEYERLVERLEERREEMDTTLDQIGAEDAFKDFKEFSDGDR